MPRDVGALFGVLIGLGFSLVMLGIAFNVRGVADDLGDRADPRWPGFGSDTFPPTTVLRLMAVVAVLAGIGFAADTWQTW